ncbi:MAG: hypothetical protein RLZZ185_88 [Bacteroidota bacterium]|jgi:Zn-dependent metalloprotease
MKNPILITLLFICFASTLDAQENNYQPASDCSNYNAFAKSSQIELVKPLVSAVRENGTLLLNPEKEDSMDLLFQKLGVTTGTAFQLVKETKSRLDSTKFFRKYQQYYYGVEVDGGGYTTAYIGPGGPTDPCAEAYMMAPHILTEISLNHNPTVPSTNIPSILEVQNVESSKLLVTHNLTNQCEYRLVWRVAYNKDYPKISWIDAHTGSVIQTIDSRMNHNAPTPTYGNQFLNDRTDGNSTSLQTPDGRVRTYDFNANCPIGINLNEWTENLIPVTNNATEWTNEADPEVYQVFHVVSSVVPEFDELDIEFGVVRAAACDDDNAFSLFGSTIDNAFIQIGFWNDRPFSLFDLAAHELGHTYLNQFLNYTNTGNRSLHEGISDIIGTYIESQIQGNVDWIMFDDEPLIGNDQNTIRNLEDPVFDCLTTAPTQQHSRGQPIGHWYFLISQGSQANSIPALGMLPALNILLEALPQIGVNSDYPDLMEATMTVVEDQFGRCSNEFLAVARAWEAICVPTGFANSNGVVPPCSVSICGDGNIVCEENEYFNLCACGVYPPGTYFRWTIIGKKSTEYESVYGMEGNRQEGGNCLTLIDFPKYPYYPQYITIKLYSPTLAGLGVQSYSVERRIKLVDCNGDDPTCEEYNELQNEEGEDRFSYSSSEQTDIKYVKVRAFDLMGRQVFEKNTSSLQRNELQYHGILVLIFYSEKGEIVKVSKAFLTD